MFSAEEKQSILSQYENATESSAENLVQILTEAKQKQDEYVVSMVKADPSFKKNMETFLHDTASSMKSAVAKSGKAVLEDLERQLDL